MRADDMRHSPLSSRVNRLGVAAWGSCARACGGQVQLVEHEHAAQQSGVVDHDRSRHVCAAGTTLLQRVLDGCENLSVVEAFEHVGRGLSGPLLRSRLGQAGLEGRVQLRQVCPGSAEASGAMWGRSHADESGETKYQASKVDDMKVYLYGDTAIVSGRWKGKFTEKGKAIDSTERFTDTFVRQNGQWKCVASQGTTIK